MSTYTNPTGGSGRAFRLSQLIYDTRYRSITIQMVALISLLLIFGWLINNTMSNLAALGKEPSFRFFSEPAGYDINQRLIEYNSQSSHLRAAFVGLFNTLLIAVLGCVMATGLGILIGILQLSKNWLIAKISRIYVEMFRNVPLLLWILFAMAIMIEVPPAPKEFRGADPSASMILFDSMAVTNRGIYIPEPHFSRGLGDIPLFGLFNISMNFLLIAAVLIASLWVARRIKQLAIAHQEATGEIKSTIWLRLAVIFGPLILTLSVLGFHLGYPELKGFNFKGGLHLRNSLLALWLALSLYTAAFIAEIVRAGILAVSKGQTEAASALGLRPNRVMRLVILPQALRVIIPPLISQYLNLTKNSSLAIAVGYMDLTGTLMGITLNQTGRELETVLIGMLIYLSISLTVSLAMNAYNESVKLKER